MDARLGVEDGSTLAVLGPNGSGKSTVLAAIAGTVRPAGGSVRLGAEVLHDLDARRATWTHPRRRRVALVTQGDDLFPALTVLDNVAFGLRSRGWGKADARAQSRSWLARAGLADVADRPARELSGGQARRVAIVRALASRPRVLLLDEPFAGVDVEAAAELRALIARETRDVTTVLTTHDPLDARLLADRVSVLDAGTVAESGSVDAVLSTPRTPFAAAMAGRVLVRGAADGDAVVTHEGARIPADASALAHGAPAAVAVTPIGVTLGASPGDPRSVTDVVVGIEGRGDAVRVRGAVLAADVDVAALDVTVGDTVVFIVPEGLTAYSA
ncbi:sulfate/molybdate ABC transporter ATP-binding protein [Demequina sp. NBRC 110053]|uniref:sulfate/molybdate ABC transporter ATP-binding protein n=1 Tax=Demequina sp. NBRC 110053 TaxID=1570342 RepID=UPI001F1D86AB|nr:ATP-binding cassette domain-containing protein [Demequina sp. NBRC 110053]